MSTRRKIRTRNNSLFVHFSRIGFDEELVIRNRQDRWMRKWRKYICFKTKNEFIYFFRVLLLVDSISIEFLDLNSAEVDLTGIYLLTKSTMETPEQCVESLQSYQKIQYNDAWRHWLISDIVLVFLLPTLNKQMPIESLPSYKGNIKPSNQELVNG